ncbi:MAG: hypothetical protein O7E54_14055 [Planctomycetota bacterium]|nr:hypothetical protein [Planctomycetota bacterium]
MRKPILCTALLTACISYKSEDVRLPVVADAIEARPGGRFDFEDAAARARARSPALLAQAARARAAGADIPPANVFGSANFRQDHWRIAADPLALARLGPRGAASKAAAARQFEALAVLGEMERSIAADVAECFLVERVLRDRRAPEIPDDTEAFRSAGLASVTHDKMIRAARASARTESLEIESTRRENLARLRYLLALGPAAELDLVLPEGPFPALPEPTRSRLLSRPELAVMLARYRTADAEFRQAVVEQYPRFVVGGELPLNPPGAGAIVALKIPIGASARARAAGARREAARLAIEEALLRAQHDAEKRTAALEASKARSFSTARSATAASDRLRTSLVRLELDPDSFGAAAEAALRAVRVSARAREAAVAEGRDRVSYVEAYGWPLQEETP